MAATSKKKAKTQTKKKSTKKTTSKKRVAKKASAAKKTAKKKIVAKKAVKKRPAAKKTKKKSPSRKKVTKKTVKKAAGKRPTAKKTIKKKAVKKKAAKKKATKKVAKKKTAVKAKRISAPRRRRAGKNGEMIHGIAPYRAKRGEEYMNAGQLEHFREILYAWRRELIDEINRTLHSMQDETINHPDPNDRATQETDMSLELRSRDRERKLIKKIDDTVALIDSGDYGYCINCGVEVGIARLEARPTANLCIDCKTLDEIREKQMI